MGGQPCERVVLCGSGAGIEGEAEAGLFYVVVMAKGSQIPRAAVLWDLERWWQEGILTAFCFLFFGAFERRKKRHVGQLEWPEGWEKG